MHNPERSPAKKLPPKAPLPREITKMTKAPEDIIKLSDEDIEEITELNESDLESVEEPTRIESRERETALRYGMASEASVEHPERNEDAVFYSQKRGLQFVADGMGGVPAGDYASAKAAEQLTRDGLQKASEKTQKVLLAERQETQNQEDVEQAINEIIKQMDREIVTNNQGSEIIQKKAKEYIEKEMGEYDPENPQHRNILNGLLKSIGCTVSMSKVWRGADGKDRLTIGNVGDSRTYRLRGGKLEKLSEDHSHVQVLLKEGLIQSDEDVETQIDKRKIMALEDKYPEIRALIPSLVRSPNQFVTIDSIRNKITMAAGVGEMMKKQYGIEFQPFIKTYDLDKGDVIFTASDGVIDNLTDSEIEGILLLNAENPTQAANELKQAALERSIKGKDSNPRAKKDDITALVTRYE